MRQEFSAQGWERLHTALAPAGSSFQVTAHLARGRGDLLLPGKASIDATDHDPAPLGAAQTHFPSLEWAEATRGVLSWSLGSGRDTWDPSACEESLGSLGCVEWIKAGGEGLSNSLQPVGGQAHLGYFPGCCGEKAQPRMERRMTQILPGSCRDKADRAPRKAVNKT